MPSTPPTHKPRRVQPRRSAADRGYDATWRRLRRVHLVGEPYCRMCAAAGRIVVADVVDHIIPVRVRPDLRLDISNLQSLCASCHDGAKSRDDNRRYGRGRW
jgi:5-methylcytosine-specific restriction protein A